MIDDSAAGQEVSVQFVERSTFLFLADGRIFLRDEDGHVKEADASQREDAAALLAREVVGELDPIRGLQLVPPADS